MHLVPVLTASPPSDARAVPTPMTSASLRRGQASQVVVMWMCLRGGDPKLAFRPHSAFLISDLSNLEVGRAVLQTKQGLGEYRGELLCCG